MDPSNIQGPALIPPANPPQAEPKPQPAPAAEPTPAPQPEQLAAPAPAPQPKEPSPFDNSFLRFIARFTSLLIPLIVAVFGFILVGSVYFGVAWALVWSADDNANTIWLASTGIALLIALTLVGVTIRHYAKVHREIKTDTGSPKRRMTQQGVIHSLIALYLTYILIVGLSGEAYWIRIPPHLAIAALACELAIIAFLVYSGQKYAKKQPLTFSPSPIVFIGAVLVVFTATYFIGNLNIKKATFTDAQTGAPVFTVNYPVKYLQEDGPIGFTAKHSETGETIQGKTIIGYNFESTAFRNDTIFGPHIIKKGDPGHEGDGDPGYFPNAASLDKEFERRHYADDRNKSWTTDEFSPYKSNYQTAQVGDHTLYIFPNKYLAVMFHGDYMILLRHYGPVMDPILKSLTFVN